MIVKSLAVIFIFSVSVLIISGCGSISKPMNQASPLIKVQLYEGNEIQIKPFKNYILSVNSRKEVGDGPLYISFISNRMELNGVCAEVDSIEIYPARYFEFQGKKYAGNASVIKTQKGLMLINIIDIETYLHGVLPNEVPTGWNLQALKAQAVVSRTYALYEVANSRKSNKEFDLYSDTRSQVYNGIENETELTSLAIYSTIGEVLKYQGRIIQSFFHASSGGMTESSREVFNDDKPYLTPVPSPYSTYYKENKWDIAITLKKLEEELKLTNSIIKISVPVRTISKRIKTIEIDDQLSNKIRISGQDFRNIVGPQSMKSTRANIHISNDFVLISGVGYGHGVGMGQWDAFGMASQGYQYKDIVTYFYHGTSVDKIW